MGLILLCPIASRALDCADMGYGQVYAIKMQLDSCHVKYDTEAFDRMTQVMYQRGLKAIFFRHNLFHAVEKVIINLDNVKSEEQCIDLSQATDGIKAGVMDVLLTCKM